jgi:hypothetical protein
MSTEFPLIGAVPPLGEVTVQVLMESNAQPVGSVPSVIVYPPVGKTVMPLKVVVAPAELLASRLKFVKGDGLAVNGKVTAGLVVVGVADLMIVMLPGKMTASAES